MHTIEWVFSGIGGTLLLLVGGWAYRRWRPAPPPHAAAPPINQPVGPSTALLHKNTHAALKLWLNTDVRIKKGDYYFVGDNYWLKRVAVNDIRTELLPDNYSQHGKAQLAVELDLDLGG